MLKREDIKRNAAISGIEPGHVVRIVTTEPVGDSALTVYYKTPDGKLLDRMLFHTDEANLSLTEAGRRAFAPLSGRCRVLLSQMENGIYSRFYV